MSNLMEHNLFRAFIESDTDELILKPFNYNHQIGDIVNYTEYGNQYKCVNIVHESDKTVHIFKKI